MHVLYALLCHYNIIYSITICNVVYMYITWLTTMRGCLWAYTYCIHMHMHIIHIYNFRYNAQDILFTATDTRQVHAWKFSKNSNMFAHTNNNKHYKQEYISDIVGTYTGHTDVVLDLLVLDNMGIYLPLFMCVYAYMYVYTWKHMLLY